MTVIKVLHCAESKTSYSYFCQLVQNSFLSGEDACHLFSTALMGLHRHGQHETMQTSLLLLGVNLYGLLVRYFVALNLITCRIQSAICRSTVMHTTHWGKNKMDETLQTTFSKAFFFLMKNVSWLRFHWNLFPRVQITLVHIGSDNGLALVRRQTIIGISGA